MRPKHIEDYLANLHRGGWLEWTDHTNKIYANLKLTDKIWDNTYTGTIHEEGMIDNPHSLPTEKECTDGLAQMQTDYDNAKTKKETDKANAITKLKGLGLTEDEAKAYIGDNS